MSHYTPVSLPISSPPGSGSVVSEAPIPVLNTMSLSGPPVPVFGMIALKWIYLRFLYWVCLQW